MAHIEHLPTNAASGSVGMPAPIHELLKSGLRRAFPLPTSDQGNESFHHLLEALAQRSLGNRPAASHTQPPHEATLDDRILVTMLVGTAFAGLGATIGGAYGISLLVAFLL